MAHYSSSDSGPSVPFHLCFFLLTLFFLLGFSWYSTVESFVEQVKVVLMVSPLFLLLTVHLLSNYGGRGALWSLIPLPEKEMLHRAGGTPWGVGLILVVLLFVISYR